jgi:hypothetical protein
MWTHLQAAQEAGPLGVGWGTRTPHWRRQVVEAWALAGAASRRLH